MSDFVIGIRDIERAPGEMREREIEPVLREAWGDGVVVVPDGARVDADVRLESLHEGILATTHAETTAVGECSRCLDPIEVGVRVDFAELFAYDSVEGFELEVRSSSVDLEQPLRDAVVLALPFQPVCRPDCPGLDPITGDKRPAPASDSGSGTADPRWAALADFEASTSNDSAEGH